MAFSAIFDVVKNILEESLPGNVHPILSLAKSDQQKNLKRKPDEHSADEDNGYYSFSKSERAAWIRQVLSYFLLFLLVLQKTPCCCRHS